jgi:putative effector of murein hydrolase LrgA (UPF0299 family)
MGSTARDMLLLLARGMGLVFLSLVSFLLFALLAGWLDQRLETFKPWVSGTTQAAIALLISGVIVAVVLSYPAKKLFGRRWSPALLALSGLPVALLSMPPQSTAIAANGGWVSVVGAVSCTLVVGVVAWLIDRLVDREASKTRDAAKMT